MTCFARIACPLIFEGMGLTGLLPKNAENMFKVKLTYYEYSEPCGFLLRITSFQLLKKKPTVGFRENTGFQTPVSKMMLH